jgi:hypothetical protein
MKKILFALTLGCTSIAAIASTTFAQKSANPVGFGDSKNFKSAVLYAAALESPVFLGNYISDAKSINTKAMKDFQARFNEASNTMWYSDGNGLETIFTRDGYSDRVFYDKKGHWEYSLIFYNENKLPRDIRAVVKSTYYDFTITLVEEVQTPDGNAYFVHLEDDQTIKIVKLNQDGDMETFQELAKG